MVSALVCSNNMIIRFEGYIPPDEEDAAHQSQFSTITTTATTAGVTNTNSTKIGTDAAAAVGDDAATNKSAASGSQKQYMVLDGTALANLEVLRNR